MIKGTKKITVLVTGVGGGGAGREMLKAVKMSPLSYRTVSTDTSPFAIGLYESDRSFIVPPSCDEGYLPRLLGICEKEKVDVLIPGSEQELKNVSEHREEFIKRRILPLINESGVIELCTSKWWTYRFLKNNGLGCPQSYLIESDKTFLEKIKSFPLVVKPAQDSRGSANIFIAQDREELNFFVRYLQKQGITPLAQEYVGSPDQEYTVGVLTDFQGALIGSIAVKRRVRSALSGGLTVKNRCTEKIKNTDVLMLSSGFSQGRVDDYPDIRRHAETVALKLGSKGPLNIQCRRTRRGIAIFEINPRFSGTTCMRAMVGYNEPDILIRHHLLGEKIARPVKYKHGIVVRGLMEKFVGKERELKTF